VHPNLVIVYGVCDGVDGELQLVLEYYEDGSLLDWLRRLDKVCCSVRLVAWTWRRDDCAKRGHGGGKATTALMTSLFC
jgi:hypothetical protein